jgi:hypothetical protein
MDTNDRGVSRINRKKECRSFIWELMASASAGIFHSVLFKGMPASSEARMHYCEPDRLNFADEKNIEADIASSICDLYLHFLFLLLDSGIPAVCQ